MFKISKTTIKTPNADEIFNKFKEKGSRKKDLEKHYGLKKTVFNVDNVTAAEFVQGVNKEAVFFFQNKIDVKPSGKTEVIKIHYNKLEKVDFYKFSKPISKDEWKGDKTVPMYETLKPVRCTECNGTGKVNCEKCGGEGTVKCPDCNGTGSIDCKPCNGKGKQYLELTLYSGEEKKKDTKKMDYSCPNCFGTGKITCSRCNGLKRILCKKCEGKSSVECKECGGTGNMWQYEILPVPFKEEQGLVPVVIPSVKIDKTLENQMGSDLSEQIIKKAFESIKLREKDLDKKIVEPNLGYINSQITKALKETQKIIKKSEKSDTDKPIWPVYLFPLLILDCVTAKGKKYNVYSIGSSQGFIVFGELP
ncbi:MAG: hypothetical protein ACTSWY_03670 [Promethearchaeota archaeon]